MSTTTEKTQGVYMKQLYTRTDDGKYSFAKPITEQQLQSIAERSCYREASKGPGLESPESSIRYAALRLLGYEQEVFAAMLLDTRHRLIAFKEMFFGTIDGATVHTREVVKTALQCNAAAVIFCHNHPSGIPDPSPADQALTRRLKEALGLIDVRVLDHVIVADEGSCSMAELGML